LHFPKAAVRRTNKSSPIHENLPHARSPAFHRTTAAGALGFSTERKKYQAWKVIMRNEELRSRVRKRPDINASALSQLSWNYGYRWRLTMEMSG
jgi:hypothetical protein